MLTLDDAQCRALLNALWERSVTGLALVAHDGKYLHANPTYCKLVEYTEAELRNRRFQDITDPEDVQADMAEAQEVLAGAKPGYDMTKRYYTKTRKSLPVMLRVTGLWLNNQFIYFVAEIAALDSPPSPPVERPAPSRFMRTIKDYWTQVVFLIGAAGSVAAAVADRLTNHGGHP